MFQTIDSHWQSQITMLCYQVSQWDRDFWHDYLQAFPHVQDNLKRGERQIKGWSLFAEEIFHRLFTLPQAIAYDQLRPEVLWAHELHQLIEQSVDFSEMQLVCRNDKQAAGMGTYRLLELALEALPKPPKGFQSPTTVAAWEQQHVEIKAQTVAVKKTLNTLQTQLKTELDPQRQTELQRQMEQMSFDLEQLKRQLRQIGRQLGRARQVAEAYAEALGDALGDVLTDAVQKALFTVQTFLGSMSAFGWGEGMGMLNHPGNADLKQQIAQRLQTDDRFRQIAEQAGRFKTIAAIRQGAKRSQHVPDEANDVSLGNQLSKLVPSEWVRVAVNSLRSLFLKDYAEESLTQTELDGAVDEQQGSVVICLDKSGSMDGKKEIDSTALTLALCGIAQEQRRNARVIFFDDKVRYVKDLTPSTVTHTDLIDLADRHYSGGTNFMEPLTQALEAIASEPDLREADIIFITDGQADVTATFSKQWRETQKRSHFKVQTLIVGTYVNPEVLDRFADTSIHVKDLDDPNVHQILDI